MPLMSPTDSMFLIPESREQPMHVGSLQLFELPEGADRSLIRETYEQLIASTDVAPLFAQRPYRSARTLGQWAWRQDEDIDLEHHVRHSALPEPGRVRELLALASRLHGTLLDRQRPLWEFHVIEGLEDNRFAVYTKLHHSVMDGVSGLRLLQRSLSEDPDARDAEAFWAPRARRTPRSGDGGSAAAGLVNLPVAAARGVADLVRLTPTVVRMAEQAIREQATVLPLQAPRSMLNVPITGARRFAAQSWPMDTIRAVGKASGTSVNDVVLAMCSSALRAYMLELDALPDAPLIAMTPVSLRRDDSGEDSGNAVGTILCNLATDRADAAERLAAIHESMRQGKEIFSGINQVQASAISAAMMLPLALTLGPGGAQWSKVVPPPYNLVISNVPGPRDPLYWNGARLQGVYPLSIPTVGQALNITVTSYAGNMEFGLIGCRRSVPHLQRLLTHLDDALEELVKVSGA